MKLRKFAKNKIEKKANRRKAVFNYVVCYKTYDFEDLLRFVPLLRDRIGEGPVEMPDGTCFELIPEYYGESWFPESIVWYGKDGCCITCIDAYAPYD